MKQTTLAQMERCETQLRNFFIEVMSGVEREPAKPAASDKWSAKDHLAHLARYHEIFLERIHRILNEPNPSFLRYRAEDDAQWETWRRLPYGEVVERLSSLREKLVARLRSLNDVDYQKTGIHPKFGEMPLSLWLEFFLVHEGHHLYVVFQQVRSG